MSNLPGKKKLVFVCGTARSGSTFLDLTLSARKQAFGCGEIYAFYRPWKKHHGSICCSCGDDNCFHWARLSGLKPSQVHSEIFEREDVSFVVDSSKNLNWVIDSIRWARTKGYDCVVVVTWKRPIDLAYSFWRRDRLDWRAKFMEYYKRVLEIDAPLVSVCHSDVVENPTQVMSNLFNYLDMPKFEQIDEDFHFIYGSSGFKENVKKGNFEPRKEVEQPDSFARIRGGIEQEIASDSELNELVGKLKLKDVRLLNNYFEENNKVKEKIYAPLPYWYWKRRFADLILKCVPSLRR